MFVSMGFELGGAECNEATLGAAVNGRLQPRPSR